MLERHNRNPNLRIKADLNRTNSLYYMNELYRRVCINAVRRWANKYGYSYEQIRLQQGVISELEIVARFNDDCYGTVYVDLWWATEERTNVECELSYFGNGPESVRNNMPGAFAIFNTREG